MVAGGRRATIDVESHDPQTAGTVIRRMCDIAGRIGGAIVDHHDFGDLRLHKGGADGDIYRIRCIFRSDDDANGL